MGILSLLPVGTTHPDLHFLAVMQEHPFHLYVEELRDSVKLRPHFINVLPCIGDKSDIPNRTEPELGREQNPSCEDLFVCLLNLLQCIAVNSFSRKGSCRTLRFED